MATSAARPRCCPGLEAAAPGDRSGEGYAGNLAHARVAARAAYGDARFHVERGMEEEERARVRAIARGSRLRLLEEGGDRLPGGSDPRPQRDAAAELRRALDERSDEAFVVEHFGSNVEGARIRWTPRKVFRVSRRLQDAWLAHAIRGDAQPTPRHGVPLIGNEDEPEDDKPLSATETPLCP